MMRKVRSVSRWWLESFRSLLCKCSNMVYFFISLISRFEEDS